MTRYQENALVAGVEELSPVHRRLTLYAPQIAAAARPGQFVMVRVCDAQAPLLRRPFSIHNIVDGDTIQIYFGVVGQGTKRLAAAAVGESFSVLGPLGRPFDIQNHGSSIFVGGGLGIAPLLFLVAENCRLKEDCQEDLVILGGRSANDVAPLYADFQQYPVKLECTTDDGSFGVQGLVTDLLGSRPLSSEAVVYTCGPEAMMAAVARICKQAGVSCQVSVEGLMACGMGACLGCARPDWRGSYVHVCVHGPVFDAQRLGWDRVPGGE